MVFGNYSNYAASRGLQSAGGSGKPETIAPWQTSAGSAGSCGSCGSSGSCGSCGSTGYDVPWGGYQSSGGSAGSAENTGDPDRSFWEDWSYHEKNDPLGQMIENSKQPIGDSGLTINWSNIGCGGTGFSNVNGASALLRTLIGSLTR